MDRRLLQRFIGFELEQQSDLTKKQIAQVATILAFELSIALSVSLNDATDWERPEEK